ncbi:RAD3-like DNA-binding helicase protein, partial [Prunus dulcis]
CFAMVVDRRQQQKTEDRIESDRNGAKDGQVDPDDSEEMKTKMKEKFGIGFRRADKRRNHENCRDLFSRSVEEEPCTKEEGNNLQMSNDAVELSDEDFLVEDYESEEEGNLGGGKSKRKVAGVSLSSSSEEDEEDGSGDDEYEEGEKLQLSQFIKELKKTVFANEMKVVCLGSRRNFCINEDVLKLGNSTRINERCLELQRNKNKEVSKIKNVGAGGRIRRNKASCGCPMLRKHKLQKEFKSMMSQQGALDIEDLVHLGKSMRTCPYYGSRSMVTVADLLEDVHSHIEKYFERFCNVLGPGNRRYIQTLMVLTRAFRQVFLKDDRSYGDSCRDTEKASGANNINLVKLLQYIKESNIMHKVSGYGDKVASFQKKLALHGSEDGSTLSSFQALANLLLSLTNKDGDGRIIISRTCTTCSREEGRYIKYVMLTGDKIFSEIQELGQLLCNLVTVVPEGIVVFFSSFDYEGQVYDAWEASGILERIKKKKHLFREPRKNTYVESVLKEYKETIDTLSSGERKENPSQSGAMLLAVVGGKISEGINLSDGMGRCIVMVGLPYASPSDIELMERVKYIEGLGDSDSTKTPNLSLGNELCSGEVHAGFNVLRSCRRRGKEYYENLCMKAVNQSIGRAIRHINDYAAILLVDTRYASDSSKRNFCHPTSKLPQWIKDRFVASTDYGEVHRMLYQFFKHNKKRWLQQ